MFYYVIYIKGRNGSKLNIVECSSFQYCLSFITNYPCYIKVVNIISSDVPLSF